MDNLSWTDEYYIIQEVKTSSLMSSRIMSVGCLFRYRRGLSITIYEFKGIEQVLLPLDDKQTGAQTEGIPTLL